MLFCRGGLLTAKKGVLNETTENNKCYILGDVYFILNVDVGDSFYADGNEL